MIWVLVIYVTMSQDLKTIMHDTHAIAVLTTTAIDGGHFKTLAECERAMGKPDESQHFECFAVKVDR